MVKGNSTTSLGGAASTGHTSGIRDIAPRARPPRRCTPPTGHSRDRGETSAAGHPSTARASRGNSHFRTEQIPGRSTQRESRPGAQDKRKTAPVRIRSRGSWKTGAQIPLLAGAGLVGGRYPAIERGGLSQLNPLGVAIVKAAKSTALVWQSVALFKVYFNWDCRCHAENRRLSCSGL